MLTLKENAFQMKNSYSASQK